MRTIFQKLSVYFVLILAAMSTIGYGTEAGRSASPATPAPVTPDAAASTRTPVTTDAAAPIQPIGPERSSPIIIVLPKAQAQPPSQSTTPEKSDTRGDLSPYDMGGDLSPHDMGGDLSPHDMGGKYRSSPQQPGVDVGRQLTTPEKSDIQWPPPTRGDGGGTWGPEAGEYERKFEPYDDVGGGQPTPSQPGVDVGRQPPPSQPELGVDPRTENSARRGGEAQNDKIIRFQTRKPQSSEMRANPKTRAKQDRRRLKFKEKYKSSRYNQRK
ncbi:MAG: hypothetical protein KR126chlam2_00127 [Chlamydiae bacterium]|nr:hypothetical protein [Chlamydiota bacterium]